MSVFWALTFYFVVFLMGWLGYRRGRLWVPAATAAGATALSILVFYTAVAPWRWQTGPTMPTFSGAFLNVLALNLPVYLAVFYAAYGVGRGLARWRKGKASG